MFLPKPFPDEVLGSVIARGAWQYGLPLKVFLRALLGPSRSYFSFLMGNCFAKLSSATGMDAEALLMLHTVFPYATAFMPAGVKAELKSKALLPSAGVDCISSVTKTASHGVPFRRVCPGCVKEEVATYGESYWHRQHLLPGTLVCLIHGTMLADTSIPLRGSTQSRDVTLPHMVSHEPVFTDLPVEQLVVIAERSVQALGTDFTPGAGLQQYRDVAIELGYKLPSGDVATSVLATHLQNFYGHGFLEDAGCPLATRAPWPALMVRPGTDGNFATPKHVLLDSFMALDSGAPLSLTVNFAKRGPKTTDFARLDSELSRGLQSAWKKVAKEKRRVTLKQLISDLGSWGTYKHNRERLPLTSKVVAEFRVSEQSERQLGVREVWRQRFPKRYSK